MQEKCTSICPKGRYITKYPNKKVTPEKKERKQWRNLRRKKTLSHCRPHSMARLTEKKIYRKVKKKPDKIPSIEKLVVNPLTASALCGIIPLVATSDTAQAA